MLDANVVSELMRNPYGSVADHIERVGESNLCLSIIAASELRYGAARTRSARLMAHVEAMLSRLPVLPLAPPADAEYGALRTELEAAGQAIGPNDLLIASHALAIGATMVTANIGEFQRVRRLQVENWVSRGPEA
jgi:tRNA(fMet)-specific endonuclease VapC